MQKRDSFKHLQHFLFLWQKGNYHGNRVTKLRYGGQQEQPTILISMLLLCMLSINNVASIHIPANFF